MEQKKKWKLFKAFMPILMVGLVVIVTIYMKRQVRPEVSINGQKIWVGMTVQELVDEGFLVGLTAYEGDIVNLDAQPQVPGETHNPKHYHVYKDEEFMLVDFSVSNTDVNSCEFADSKIYTIHFNPGLDFSSDIELLVNGINVGGMEKEEALNAFERLGVKFDREEKEEYLSGKNGFVVGRSGEYSFEFETYDDHKGIDSIRVRMSV